MAKSIVLQAFAKANLSLNITGVQDGMHTLDSVMMSLDSCDTVTVTERSDTDIRVAFTNADIGSDNTARKAACLVQNAIGGNGWDITIEKGIPVGAGLGGSSADAAAVLRALDLFYRLPKRGADMQKIALEVGSDVPFMLTGGLARVRGTGGDTFFMENKLKLFAVGLMSESVSTAAAYKAFDGDCPSREYAPTDNDKLCELLMNGDKDAVRHFANALAGPATRLCPSIDRDTKLLEKQGAVACLTGSGGMTLGWFTDLGKFASAVDALKCERGVSVFTHIKTGILHKWLAK